MDYKEFKRLLALDSRPFQFEGNIFAQSMQKLFLWE